MTIPQKCGGNEKKTKYRLTKQAAPNIIEL